jgi:hypothetical protein
VCRAARHSALIGALAMALIPSDVSRVATALSSRKVIALQSVDNFVERQEVAHIITIVERGEELRSGQGGYRMGKSVAVKAAAARLSLSRTVLWSFRGESAMELALLELYGVERNTLVDRVFSIVRNAVEFTCRCAEACALLEPRSCQSLCSSLKKQSDCIRT